MSVIKKYRLKVLGVIVRGEFLRKDATQYCVLSSTSSSITSFWTSRRRAIEDLQRLPNDKLITRNSS